MNTERAIKDAFAEVPFPFAEADADHWYMIQALRKSYGEEQYDYLGSEPDNDINKVPFYKWYFDLFLFTPDVIQYVIPRLMVRLLSQYPDESEYVEDVIDFLNVPSTTNMHNLPSTEDRVDHTVGGTISSQKEAQYFKEQSLSLFTPQQVGAILHWLGTVRNWNELQEAVANIDAAIGYWRGVRERL